MKLVNKIAIVTGAGRGIGRAISLAFAREGADVIAIARTDSEIENTCGNIRTLGRRSLALKADVSIREDVGNAISSVISNFGRVDVLVNCAGILGPVGPVAENNVDDWIQTIQVNLIGTFLCTRAVLPTMIENRYGKIINFSGGGAAYGRPYFTAYASSKTAVVRLTESLAEEVKGCNIDVNAIAPGAVDTQMLRQILLAGCAAGEKELSKVEEQLGATNTIEKPIALAIFLASAESNGLSGRLISAVWDDWQNMRDKMEKIAKSDLYTLRRITTE